MNAYRIQNELMMTRLARLQAGKVWIPKFKGKDVVRGYARWYGVDRVCAIVELRMLGVHIDEEYVKRVQKDVLALSKARQKKKAKKAEDVQQLMAEDLDENCAYIAGSDNQLRVF